MVALLKQTGHTRLYRRGAYYYHRAMVPTDIKEAYKLAYGKLEETFSLKTTSRAEALRLEQIAVVVIAA